MIEGSTRMTVGAGLGWIGALGATLALARVAPGAAFSIGIGLTVGAALWYVPSRPLGDFRLNEAAALLVLLIGLTLVSAPSDEAGSCSVLAPGELTRRDFGRDPTPWPPVDPSDTTAPPPLDPRLRAMDPTRLLSPP